MVYNIIKMREELNIKTPEGKMKYYIINKSTGISHDVRNSKVEAEKVAEEMTSYHNREYVVSEK
jgi:hypothetical protein